MLSIETDKRLRLASRKMLSIETDECIALASKKDALHRNWQVAYISQ